MTEPTAFPSTGRLAGIDYGSIRIGVAICDPDRIIASPLVTYSRATDEADARFFRELIAEERIVGFVIGLPVHMSGDEGEKARAARRLGQWLFETTKLPVCFQDERFTTIEASQVLEQSGLKRRKADQRRDKLAAQAILARFLETGSIRSPSSVDE